MVEGNLISKQARAMVFCLKSFVDYWTKNSECSPLAEFSSSTLYERNILSL